MLGLLAATPTMAVTSEMIEPIVDSIVGNIAVVMPIGITVFGIMLGLRVVPRIVHMFF